MRASLQTGFSLALALGGVGQAPSGRRGSMVETMIGYGARLGPGEFEILVGYLATTY